MAKLKLQDEELPCAEHLDPDGTMLPTSSWIHIDGTLPICSLYDIQSAVEKIVREEAMNGIVDLDAPWNPLQQDVPTVKVSNEPIVEAAHVAISPFGRPNGWHLKLANRSLVNAILTRAQRESLRVSWKVVQAREYHYHKEKNLEEDHAWANGLVVDDSMVRFENCPVRMNTENLRHLLSRYDLAPKGNTIIHWEGVTSDGKRAPRMFVVRFASAAWARAAVRELQSTRIEHKTVKVIQYPKQLRIEAEDERRNQQ